LIWGENARKTGGKKKPSRCGSSYGYVKGERKLDKGGVFQIEKHQRGKLAATPQPKSHQSKPRTLGWTEKKPVRDSAE